MARLGSHFVLLCIVEPFSSKLHLTVTSYIGV